jgi:hypothetical protein
MPNGKNLAGYTPEPEKIGEVPPATEPASSEEPVGDVGAPSLANEAEPVSAEEVPAEEPPAESAKE